MWLSTLCIVALLGLAGQASAQTRPQPSAAKGQRKYTVGQRVDYHYDGKWFKAIVTKVRDNDRYQYRIHPLGYETTMDTWVPEEESWIRAAGSGPTEPVPGGEANDEVLKAMRGATTPTPAGTTSTQPPAKQYHCVYFVQDHLVDAAPFTLMANSAYTDSDGRRGTYSFNAASATLSFHGGNYDGQRAAYDTKGGLPQLHILGATGRRVIDCD